MMFGKGGRLLPIPLDDQTTGAKLFLTQTLLTETSRLLRTYGNEKHEGIVYLGGLELPGNVAVALVALSPVATTTRGSFTTEVEANASVVSKLGALDLTLIGQVHSHPGEWVDHSDGDDTGALVRFEGFWSIVVPCFAASGMEPLVQCGIHVFGHGCFRRLTKDAVLARVRIVPAAVDLRA